MVRVFSGFARRYTICIRKVAQLFCVAPMAAMLLSSCDTTEVEQVEYAERSSVYNEGEDLWSIVTVEIFREIERMETFALIVPLYKELEDLSGTAGDKKRKILNSKYLLIHTPATARVNNMWYIVAMNGAEETASVIGRGGEIESLVGDMYSAPGFDKSDKRQCVPTGGLIFPQRRVQSCYETDCSLVLYLNGTNGSPDFTAIHGSKGWHLLVREGEGRDYQECVFDTGTGLYLLETGQR